MPSSGGCHSRFLLSALIAGQGTVARVVVGVLICCSSAWLWCWLRCRLLCHGGCRAGGLGRILGPLLDRWQAFCWGYAHVGGWRVRPCPAVDALALVPYRVVGLWG